MSLSSDQSLAVESFLSFMQDPSCNEMVLTGGPGVGKSYITKHFISLLRDNKEIMKMLTSSALDYPIIFTASTNKAAKVLQDMVGEEATTIHSKLGLRVKNNFKTGKTNLSRGRGYSPISRSLIIIDECSMIDTELLQEIRDSTFKCKILYIGDKYQLAPIFESSCPVFDIPIQVELTTPHRQNAGSPIHSLAKAFKEAVITGKFPRISSNGSAVQVLKGADFQTEMDKAYLNGESAKIIAWTNGKVSQYNQHVRQLLGLSKIYSKGEYLVANSPIMVGPKTIYKSDTILKVTHVDRNHTNNIAGSYLNLNNENTVFVADNFLEVTAHIQKLAKQKNWRAYFHAKDFYADLRPVHASTVHKAQGSSYTKVFIDLADIGRNTRREETARLLHVAISRATTQVFFHGELPNKYQS